MNDKIAIINLGDYKEQIEIESMHLGFNGFVSIVSKNGLLYETHIANVLFKSAKRSDNNA